MKHKKCKLFFLLLILFFVSFFERIEAEERFSKEVADIGIDYGINGFFRANSILLVNFKFKNIKKDFLGRVEFRYFSDNGAPCSIVKELSLLKGSTKEVCFYPYLNSGNPNFLILIFDGNGKIIWEKKSEIDHFDIDSNSDIVVGELERAGTNFTFKGETLLNVKRKAIRTRDIPSDYLGLKPFDIIVVPDGYPENKREKGSEVIAERRAKGGLVVEEKDLPNIDLNRVLLTKEDRDDWMWRVEKVVGTILRDLTVKSGRYIFVLAIYILIVSPITYFLLYKRKKRNWYYLTVPLTSIFFTLVMYGVGSDSRISGLKINYISVLDLRLNRSFENTIFAVTNSTNRSYDISVSNGYRVEPAFGLYKGSEKKDKLYGRVKRKVYEHRGRTDITIGEGAAFETVYFRAEGNPDLNYGNMGKMSRKGNRLVGEFRNKLGIDLENVFAVFDDEVTYLGSVKNETIKEFDTEDEKTFLSDLTGHIVDSLLTREVFQDREDHDELSKEALMSMLIGKLSYRKYDKPLFLGVSKNRLGNEFANKIGASDGYSIFILSAETDVDLTKETFVNSLNKLPYTIEEEKDGFLFYTFPNRKITTVTYQLPKKKFSRLSYYRRYNNLINPYTISLKNRFTDRFETIFYPDLNYKVEIMAYAKSQGKRLREVISGRDMSLSDLSKYIENGEITVRYEIDSSVYSSVAPYMALQIPKLSLE